MGLYRKGNSRISSMLLVMGMLFVVPKSYSLFGKGTMASVSCGEDSARHDRENSSYSVFKYSLSARRLMGGDSNSNGITPASQRKFSNLSYSGVVDFISFYRYMQGSYAGLSTPAKNLEFTPYPSGSQFNGNFYRQPLLDLIIAGSPTSNTSFAVEYAISHFFTGQTGDTTRKLSVQNMLQFHGTVHTSHGNFLLTAGGGAINYSISPFTIYNKDFREPLFEKLPWDWYTNSFRKYSELFRASSTTVPSYITNTATQGFILEGTELPGNSGFSAFYGRSNFTIAPDRAYAGYPSQILAGRVYKGSDTTGKLGINYYSTFGYTDRVQQIKDNREIVTADFRYNNSKIKIYAEGGFGMVNNPSNLSGAGEAISTGLIIYNRKIGLPIFMQAYSVDKNVVALESSVLNANTSVSQGGYKSDAIYNNGYYPAYLQEVNMMANNRRGFIFRVDKVLENFRIELGNAVSAEKQNLVNAVSFEHMVNAFPRSRFRPWIQGTGPYNRLNNRYRRSFETIRITDTLSAYRKYFNASELNIKFKFNFLKRGLIFNNYCYAGTVSNSLSPVVQFSDKSFIRTFYEEFSAYYNALDKLTLIFFYGIQRNIANKETELSPDNGKPLNQKGTGIGFGIDYDFAPNAGLFIRHRWMKHTDYNFSLDHFKGAETIVELKVFF